MKDNSILNSLTPEFADIIKSMSLGKKTLPEGIEERTKLQLIELLRQVENHDGKDINTLQCIGMSVDIIKRIKEAF